MWQDRAPGLLEFGQEAQVYYNVWSTGNYSKEEVIEDLETDGEEDAMFPWEAMTLDTKYLTIGDILERRHMRWAWDLLHRRRDFELELVPKYPDIAWNFRDIPGVYPVIRANYELGWDWERILDDFRQVSGGKWTSFFDFFGEVIISSSISEHVFGKVLSAKIEGFYQDYKTGLNRTNWMYVKRHKDQPWDYKILSRVYPPTEMVLEDMDSDSDVRPQWVWREVMKGLHFKSGGWMDWRERTGTRNREELEENGDYVHRGLPTVMWLLVGAYPERLDAHAYYLSNRDDIPERLIVARHTRRVWNWQLLSKNREIATEECIRRNWTLPWVGERAQGLKREEASKVIQRWWKEVYYSPYTRVGHERLMREHREFCEMCSV